MGRNGLGMKSIHGDTCFKFSSSTVYMVYSFSIATITDSHKYSDLFSYSSGHLKSELGLTELKARGQ